MNVPPAAAKRKASRRGCARAERNPSKGAPSRRMIGFVVAFVCVMAAVATAEWFGQTEAWAECTKAVAEVLVRPRYREARLLGPSRTPWGKDTLAERLESSSGQCCPSRVVGC